MPVMTRNEPRRIEQRRDAGAYIGRLPERAWVRGPSAASTGRAVPAGNRERDARRQDAPQETAVRS
jgi:hypothetical protein